MASTPVQTKRPLSVLTPLGPDKLLLVGFTGKDAISQPFRYELEMLAENKTDVGFDKLLGQKLTVTLRWGKNMGDSRFFNGVCVRIGQGERDKEFTHYRAEIVPQFWLLSRKAQSRIFQRLSVPDILKKVLVGFDVKFDIQGTFHPRDFCVQYRETDFNFASRLMEEEGIYYFFEHADGKHTMVVANTPAGHSDVPVQNTVIHESVTGGDRPELRIAAWQKVQELRSGKYTLWDHSFELPHKHLEAEKIIQDSVSVGSVSHKLKVGGNEKLEIYDFPGEYAQRFDGIDKGGGEQPAELEKIFTDNQRTTAMRIEQEALESLQIEGQSNCRQFTSGQKFTLQRHFNADGAYVLTSVQHVFTVSSADFRSASGVVSSYDNVFTCIPAALPYRPPRATAKPVVQGTQSAVVVGPSGEEIFPDKYSRVKVQFHWDREGRNDLDSSCWIRVATPWAGKQWGMIHIPRIGQEVLVDFLEGDPDQPVIIGSLYNADMMPPYQLPANKTQSGIKSRSSLGGGPSHFNEIRFEDKKGREQLFIHAERNQDIEVEADETHWVGHDRTKTIDHDEKTHVKNDRTETVDGYEIITINKDRTETVMMNETITIHMNRTEVVQLNETLTVGVAQTVTVGAAQTITVGAARTVTVGGVQTYVFGGTVTTTVDGNVNTTIEEDANSKVKGDQNSSVDGDRNLQVSGDESVDVKGKIELKAGDEIVLGCGAASITMKKDGTINIEGMRVTVNGTATADLTGAKVGVKGTGMVEIQGALVKIN